MDNSATKSLRHHNRDSFCNPSIRHLILITRVKRVPPWLWLGNLFGLFPKGIHFTPWHHIGSRIKYCNEVLKFTPTFFNSHQTSTGSILQMQSLAEITEADVLDVDIVVDAVTGTLQSQHICTWINWPPFLLRQPWHYWWKWPIRFFMTCYDPAVDQVDLAIRRTQFYAKSEPNLVKSQATRVW